MRGLIILMLATVAMLGHALPARATIQPESCLDPDVEFPVPCDEDED